METFDQCLKVSSIHIFKWLLLWSTRANCDHICLFNLQGLGEPKICSNGFGWLSKMATMPILGICVLDSLPCHINGWLDLCFKVTRSNDFTCEALGHLWSYFIFSLLGWGERKFIHLVLVCLPRWPPCPYWASLSLVHKSLITQVPQESNTGPSWSSCFFFLFLFLELLKADVSY